MDDYSRYTWIHLLNHKSYAFTLIKALISLIKTQFDANIKSIRIDNAFELGSSNEGIDFFQEKGIIHQRSTPHNP